MKNTAFLFLAAMLSFSLNSCEEDCPEGPNDLRGDTDIPLTVVGNVSDLYVDLGGSNISGSMTLTEKTGGLCTYHALIDFTGHPDSALYTSLIPSSYFDDQGRFSYDITMNITSEGIQEYSFDGSIDNPWTIVKYDDAVGTTYPFRDGSPNVRTVTEKTGVDDFPFGFMYIKVSKVEQPYPENDEYVKKISYYANHKYGLVRMEVELKSGAVVKCDIMPWFLI